MNWDYRYCWLRDASFTVSCLINAGYLDEATRWRDWVLRAFGGAPGELQIMYRVDGARHLDEREISSLPGWNHARPVRVGNLAAKQRQVDVYGELLYAFDLGLTAGMPATEQQRVVSSRVAEHLARVWTTSGSGIWESRAEPRHYTYSKAMAWVGLDRFVQRHSGSGDHAELIGDWPSCAAGSMTTCCTRAGTRASVTSRRTMAGRSWMRACCCCRWSVSCQRPSRVWRPPSMPSGESCARAD